MIHEPSIQKPRHFSVMAQVHNECYNRLRYCWNPSGERNNAFWSSSESSTFFLSPKRARIIQQNPSQLFSLCSSLQVIRTSDGAVLVAAASRSSTSTTTWRSLDTRVEWSGYVRMSASTGTADSTNEWNLDRASVWELRRPFWYFSSNSTKGAYDRTYGGQWAWISPEAIVMELGQSTQ